MEKMKHVPVRCKKELRVKVEKSGVSKDITRSVLQRWTVRRKGWGSSGQHKCAWWNQYGPRPGEQ